MNNIPQSLVPERLIKSTLDFLEQMRQIDRLIQSRGYQYVLTTIRDNNPKNS